eukprot:scaffold10547_cov35-Attheya_sp.AAC.1
MPPIPSSPQLSFYVPRSFAPRHSSLHFYGDNSLHSFHASSVADMHDVTWDIELNKAVSPRDKILEDADKIDADAGFDLDEIDDDEIQRDLVDTEGMEDKNK